MRQTVQVALFASLSAALGFLLAPVPNIELFTFSLFVGGYALGFGAGALAAVLAVTIYYGLNPIGSSFAFPVLFATQFAGGLLISTLGAVYARLCPPGRGTIFVRVLLLLPFAVVAALALTLLPTLGFAAAFGGSWQGWVFWSSVMTLWGLGFNLGVFVLVFEPLSRQFHRLGTLGSAHEN